MKASVLKLHRQGYQVACIWHPEAVGEVIESVNLGNIRVRVGEPHFQLTNGDVVFL